MLALAGAGLGTDLHARRHCRRSGQARATFYSVPRGQSCAAIAQPRRCGNGRLGGAVAFGHARCTELEDFLGVNTNRQVGDLDPVLLARSGTAWIRSNIEVLEYKEQQDNGRRDPKWDFGDWQIYIAAADGTRRKAILNLMWNFEAKQRHPPRPGSPEEADLFGFLDQVILDTLAPMWRSSSRATSPSSTRCRPTGNLTRPMAAFRWWSSTNG
ncbi:hypothetical protein ACFSZS_31155 [Seohaeicola zhoushanensis]